MNNEAYCNTQRNIQHEVSMFGSDLIAMCLRVFHMLSTR